MMTITFVSEEEKERLIEKYSQEYELKETRYLFTGNELVFQEKVNGLTLEERLQEQEQKIVLQEQALAELTMYISTLGI
ncbi:hypothetical protein [Rummeliibacillus sp. TYF-LIM-RU47]|uniref:hypothetical protein n=1 Tax=Rummeliibacillus sp. TYF-LIM-RU47 TaxID=2608406 RepID=UPI001239354E|nr:hypothetical protein [Rummeliibacillus sp. TYF-LIM-RU47]